MKSKNGICSEGNSCIRKIVLDSNAWHNLMESFIDHSNKYAEADNKDSTESQIHYYCAEEIKKWMRACGVTPIEDLLLFDDDGNYIGIKEELNGKCENVQEDKPRIINIPDEAKEKIDKWITEFSARPHYIEDTNLFDALHSCVCHCVTERDLSDYLQESKDKFMDGTNTDALICHAMDCYHAMRYLVWAQNGKMQKYEPSRY